MVRCTEKSCTLRRALRAGLPGIHMQNRIAEWLESHPEFVALIRDYMNAHRSGVDAEAVGQVFAHGLIIGLRLHNSLLAADMEAHDVV